MNRRSLIMKKTRIFLFLLALICLLSGCDEKIDPNDLIAVEKAELQGDAVVVTYVDGYTHSAGTLDELTLQVPTREDGMVGIRACSATGAPGAFCDVFGTENLLETEITDRGVTKFCVKINKSYYSNFNSAVNEALYQGVTELVIPETADGKPITTLLFGAYQNFSALQKVTIPASVTTIESSAFNGCESLVEIRFGGTVEQWNSITKGEHWNAETGAYTVYCSDGEISSQIE